ncbi:MAG: asparagine synthase-related protein [Opitutales bacterium]
MCGIAFLAGPKAEARVAGCLGRLSHRGPDDQGLWVEGDIALGFVRLAINGEDALGHQPYEHGDLVGAINGQIYNHATLTRDYELDLSPCDTRVVLPLFDRLGGHVIDELDGFYAGIVLRASTREVYCLRDHMGIKPLLVGRSGSEIFIASELKAFDEVEWFEPLPVGVSKIDLQTGRAVQISTHRSVKPRRNVVSLFEAAVHKRLPSDGQPVGVFLSGGLDSSLVAAFVSREREDATYFILGDPGGPDRQVVEELRSSLGLKDVRFVPLPAREQIPELVRQVVYVTESYNPSIVSNGLATLLLAEAAREAGIKVVLTGEGADELFGGYHMFDPEDPWRSVREQLINDMPLTELRRLDLSSMAHSVEARCPFLDRDVRSFSDGLQYGELYGDGENKVTLRRGFEEFLPQSVLERRKISFDVGSGLRGEVVRYLRQGGVGEREALRKIWEGLFSFKATEPYFHAYPVFDEAIDRRGATHR